MGVEQRSSTAPRSARTTRCAPQQNLRKRGFLQHQTLAKKLGTGKKKQKKNKNKLKYYFGAHSAGEGVREELRRQPRPGRTLGPAALEGTNGSAKGGTKRGKGLKPSSGDAGTTRKVGPAQVPRKGPQKSWSAPQNIYLEAGRGKGWEEEGEGREREGLSVRRE